MKSSTFKKYTEDLDEPMKFWESWEFLKKGRVRLIIIFEDQSYKEYYRKLKENYAFTVKDKKYFILPKCILLGKNPTLTYYYNNPMPIKYAYVHSKISAENFVPEKDFAKLDDKEKRMLAMTVLDAEAINTAFSSNLVNKMYAENKLTVKAFIIILVVVFVIILIILHFTGVIDLYGLLTGKPPTEG